MSLWSRGPGHTRWYAPTRSFRWQPLAQANPVQPVHRCDLPAAGAPTFLSARACTYLSASKWTSGVSPASSPWSAWTPTLPHGPRPLDRGRPVRTPIVSQGQSETVPPVAPGPPALDRGLRGPRACSPLPHPGRRGRRPSLTDRVLWTADVPSASRSSHRDSRRLSLQGPLAYCGPLGRVPFYRCSQHTKRPCSTRMEQGLLLSPAAGPGSRVTRGGLPEALPYDQTAGRGMVTAISP